MYFYIAINTNNHFTGKSKVSYVINNYNRDNNLTVKVFKKGSLFAVKTIKITKDTKTQFGTIDGLDPNALYYLVFYAPSNFSGHLK